MKIVDSFPPAALTNLLAGLEQFMDGVGRIRLQQQGVDPASFNARGVIAEARVDIKSLDRFLNAEGHDFNASFTGLRILLFDCETPIGSVGLSGAGSGSYTVEHVTLGGAVEILQGLASAEQLVESTDSEARLLQMPQLYLTSIVLVQSGPVPAPKAFLVLTPPYPDGVAARTPSAFRAFVGRLLDEHRRVFPPNAVDGAEPE